MIKFRIDPNENQEGYMNKDTLKGNWKQLKGQARQQWGKLTEDDVERVEGSWDEMVGLIQERYGKSREEAERELEDWDKA